MPTSKNLVFIVLAFVCGAALIVCAMSKRWMAVPDGDGGFGPRGWTCETCREPFNGEMSNGDLTNTVQQVKDRYHLKHKDPSKLFGLAGMFTLFSLIIATAGLFASGVVALIKGVPMRIHAPAYVALAGLLGSMAFGLAFAGMNPLRSHGITPVKPGWPFIVFGVAVITGIVVIRNLTRIKKELDQL